jgi:hypothetical protein
MKPIENKIGVCTGISKWTAQGRNHVVHLADGSNKPICGKTYFSYDFYYADARDVNCKKCIKQCNPKK